MNRGLFDLECFDTEDALFSAAATGLAAAVEAGRVRTLALSGGRTASRLHQAVVSRGCRRAVAWAAIHWFWADERCVPPDHPASNFGAARRELLLPLGIAETQIHRIPGELPPAAAAEVAEEALHRHAQSGGDNCPRLDLVWLGMGEDGHVASLFPAAPSEAHAGLRSYVPVVGPKPPSDRVTLTYEALANAADVWVVIAGSGKDDALRTSLNDQGTTPLARLLRGRQRTRILSATGQRLALPGR